jgi:CBS domain-containing protein/ribosome-associated translation inhibitor RaiA
LSVATLPKYVEELKGLPLDSLVSSLVDSSADSNLTKIVGLLRERGVYEVFVPEATRCGMICARDILKTTNIETTKISAVMSYIPTLERGALVSEAARLMADYRVRAVPISEGRKIIGQVNCGSILLELKGKLGADIRLASLATKDPITLDDTAPVGKARELMVRKRIDHLPVTTRGRIAGTITSFQIVTSMAPPERVGSKSMKPETRHNLEYLVSDAMERDPLTCSPETSAEQALDLMLKSARTCILVTQWEELQGIATQRDFMTLLAEAEPEPEVPVFMVGLPEDPFEAEATKAKFKRTINQLHRSFPDILEARSVIKSKFTKPGRERGRYEVTVHIKTPRNAYSYSEGGYELPAIYDLITDRLKRLITQKQKSRRMRERERQEAV